MERFFETSVLDSLYNKFFLVMYRMGEILAPTEKAFDPNSTLLWENISFSESKEILIFVPYSTAAGFKGKFLDI